MSPFDTVHITSYSSLLESTSGFAASPRIFPTALSPRLYGAPWRCLRDLVFGRFSRTSTCDERMDGQTDKHATTANTAPSLLGWQNEK